MHEISPIVVCGIPRSGSTLVWQIFQEVFIGQKVLKSHPDIWVPNDHVIILTIRDPRDIVASLYRVRLSRSGEENGTMHDLENVIKRMEINFQAAEDLMKTPHHILIYEEFYHNHDPVYNLIEKEFKTKVSKNARTLISEKFSLRENKKRADKLRDFNEVDDMQIHGDHLGNVSPGHWKWSLPEWARDYIKVKCMEISEKWGYG